ncbi:MAG: multiheme c-type cytochrome [Chloroflexota bacterium]
MTNRFLLIASAFLLTTIVLTWWLQSRQVQPVAITPSLTGQIEYCLTCHADLKEISPSHPVETYGCVLCHGGERLALDADLAHSSMRGENNPSDLSVVEQSCGGSNCHSGDPAEGQDHIQRVMTSIQSTYAGAIANVRYTFGAQTDLTPLFGSVTVNDMSLPSQTGILHLDAFVISSETNPFLHTFGENCLSCHLNSTGAEDSLSTRFTGCSACHSPAGESRAGEIHTLTTVMPYTQCNTCHNRGNYDLRTMTFVERSDEAVTRLESYYQPIGQFTQCEYTLDCVDCHTRTEAMGDGDIHANQKDIEYVQCRTCHGTLTELPLTMTLTDPDDIAFRLAQLNQIMDLQVGDTILVTEQGEPLWNTRLLSDGNYELIGKATQQLFIFRPVMGSGCTQDGVEQSSAYCHECHAVEH